MIATPYPVKLTLPDPAVPRSKGIHVSSVIRCIAIEMGQLKPEEGALSLSDIREITDPTAILRISIGLAWEEWFLGGFLSQHGVVKHPGEIFLDDIYLSPDGESLNVIITPQGSRYVTVIHEVKATYKSVNTVGDLKKQWLWLTQIKSYCKAAGTLYAKIWVLFLCGDYKMPITPVISCWELKFTQEELDENWEMITQYRDEWETKI